MTASLTRRGVITRRAVLLGGAASLAGCAGMRAAGKSATPSFLPSIMGSPEPPAPPPVPPPYAPPPGEALPVLKQVAGRFAQALATYDPTDPPMPAAPPAFAGTPGDLRASVAALRVPGRFSRAEVDVVQYGGLAPVSARATYGVCLVVLRQTLVTAGGKRTVVRRTMDLRLRQRAGTWQVEEVGSVGGKRVEEPAGLGAAARAVLGDDRIALPDTARWDIYSGSINPGLLQVLTSLADVAAMDVTVLKTGHPRLVVDGRRAAPVSLHFRGRAVDVYGLDGTPVSEAPAALVRRVVQAAQALPTVGQIGVPDGFDLDGRRRRTFSNLVHADHLHIAVSSAASGAGER